MAGCFELGKEQIAALLLHFNIYFSKSSKIQNVFLPTDCMTNNRTTYPPHGCFFWTFWVFVLVFVNANQLETWNNISSSHWFDSGPGPLGVDPPLFSACVVFSTRLLLKQSHFKAWNNHQGQNTLYICSHWLTLILHNK